MRSLYRTLSLRFLQQRWSRALMVVASIALGVATLVATQALNQSAWTAARAASTPLAGADLYVGNGDSGVRRDLAAELARVPGVRAAEPLVFGRVRLPDLGDRYARLLGATWKGEVADSNPWGVRVEWLIPVNSLGVLRRADPQNLLATLPNGIRPVLVGHELAGDLVAAQNADGSPLEWGRLMQYIPGSRAFPVRVQSTAPNPPRLIAIGIVRADGPADELVRNVLIADAADAARLAGLAPDLVTRIDLFLQPGADRDQVLERVKGVLAGRAAVRTPEANDQRLEDMLAGLQIGFSLGGAGALVVGLFLVYNALAVSVAERRHEIGILRSLGATRRQVWGLFVGEAALLGLAGSVLGVPAGIGLAQLGLRPVQKILSDLLLEQEGHHLVVTAGMVLLAAGGGLVTAVLAALAPAVRAANEEPASAVRRIPPGPQWGHQALLLAASLVLMAAGAGGMLLRHSLPGRVGTFGCFALVLLGMLLTTPFLAMLLARLLQPGARRLLGIAGRLAADNLTRAPGRTGLVITALAAGVTMFIQTAGVIRSNRDPLLEWLDRTLTADLMVSAGSPITGSGQNLLLPEDLGRKMAESVPGVRWALPVRWRMADYGDRLVFLVALDAAGFAVADAAGGGAPPWREQYPELPGGARALVSENFAALYHVGPGDTIRLGGPRGPVSLRVIGTVVDYSCNRGTVIVDRGQYRKLFDDALVDEYHVHLKPGADPEAVRAALLRRWEAEHALMVTSRAEVLRHIETQIRRFAGVAYSQEVVVGVVAALGVVTALLISVLQRRRELGILRALGATRSQVLRSVLAEAALMGLIGALIGLVLGVLVEWYNMHVLVFEETGFVVPVRVPWWEAGVIAAMALATATLAGLGPALHALKLRIPEAIAYE